MPDINNNSFIDSVGDQMQTEMLSSTCDAKYFSSLRESWNVTAFFASAIHKILSNLWPHCPSCDDFWQASPQFCEARWRILSYTWSGITGEEEHTRSSPAGSGHTRKNWVPATQIFLWCGGVKGTNKHVSQLRGLWVIWGQWFQEATFSRFCHSLLLR